MKLNTKFRSSKSIIIFSFLLLVLLPTILFSLMTYHIYTKIIKNKITDNNIEIVNKINIAIENQANKMEQYINKISYNNTIQTILKEQDFKTYDITLKHNFNTIDTILNSILMKDSSCINVLLINNYIGFYHYNKRIFANEYELRQKAWFKETLRLNGKINWIGSKTSKDFTGNKINQFIISKKILNSNSFEYLGVIYATYSMSYFDSILSSINTDEQIFVTNDNNKVILSSPKIYDDIQLKDYLNISNTSNFYTDTENKKYIIVNSSSNIHGWKTYKKIPLEYLSNELLSTRLCSIVMFSICLCLFLYFLIYIYNKILTPLDNIVNIVHNFTKNPDMDLQIKNYLCLELFELKNNIISITNKNKQTERQLEITKQINKKSEIQKLQAQINPHFLYNTLTSVKYIAMLNNQPKISQLITALIRLLRNSINKEGIFITIQEELANLKNYITIENTVYEDRIKFIFTLDESINNILIPNFILQPLVENCIFHGIDPNDDSAVIIIKDYIKNNDLYFEISDNGIGMSQKQIQVLLDEYPNNKNTFTNIGIKGVHNKVKLICGEEYGLKIISEKHQGTKFIIKLPTE